MAMVTMLRLERLLLMFVASLDRSPVAPDCVTLSDPDNDLKTVHPLPTRHSRESVRLSKALNTDRWLFFSLPYFRFHTSVSGLQRFPLTW